MAWRRKIAPTPRAGARDRRGERPHGRRGGGLVDPAVAQDEAGGDEPPQAQRGREGLRRGPEVGDPLGVEALQRSDGLAVVAELRVVVVFDDDPRTLARPRQQLAAALAAEDDPRRELMR